MRIETKIFRLTNERIEKVRKGVDRIKSGQNNPESKLPRINKKVIGNIYDREKIELFRENKCNLFFRKLGK